MHEHVGGPRMKLATLCVAVVLSTPLRLESQKVSRGRYLQEQPIQFKVQFKLAFIWEISMEYLYSTDTL